MPPVPQMSNALGIWAVILTFTGCCTLSTCLSTATQYTTKKI